MSSNGNNGSTTPPNDPSSRPRRSSITAQTFTNIFRSNSTSAGAPVGPFPGPISTAANQDHKRRVSISTLGLSGASPSQSSAFPFGGRRGSVSTSASESIDESAIDDEEGPARGTPTTPFARRISFGAQALRTVRTGNGSPGSNGRTSSYTTSTLSPIPAGSQGGGRITPPRTQSQQASTQSKPRTTSDFASARPGEGGFNWPEQLRSRAESQVSQSQRPIISTSPPNNQRFLVPMHERAKSIGDAPSPPTSAIPPAAPPRPARKQPDAFQERILKGDFYMD